MIDEAEVIYWGTCPDCTTHSNSLNEPARRQEKDRTCLRAKTPSSTPPSRKRGRPHTNQDWWPNQLDLSVLHQHSPRGNPLGADFDYKAKFAELDVEELTGTSSRS